MTMYSDLTEREIDLVISDFILRVLWPRVLGVVLIYALALSLTGIGLFKSFAFCAAIWFLMVLPLGRTYIEKAGGAWLFVALLVWLDIPAVNKIVEMAWNKLIL